MNTLDVGCGKNKRGKIGVDYSRNSDADIIADGEHLPFVDEQFTETVSFAVLEHSRSPLIFLKEQYRVLKKGGKVTCETDNAQFYRYSVIDRFGFRHEDYHSDHYMIFYPKNVVRLFRLAGFRKVTCFLVRYERSKMDLFATLLIKLTLWRKECLYGRFRVYGEKP